MFSWDFYPEIVFEYSLAGLTSSLKFTMPNENLIPNWTSENAHYLCSPSSNKAPLFTQIFWPKTSGHH